MGANSNPSGSQLGANGSGLQAGGGGSSPANPSNGTVAAGANSATSTALKHNPGLSLDWSAEEQAILEEGLIKWVILVTLVF